MSTADGTAENSEAVATPVEWKPSVNPWLVALSVMLATFMTVLNSSIANVALPHIAGDLSASTNESTWVLTSYLISNAIMLPASGWIARRIGRKKLLMVSIIIFVVSSLLCGLATTMPLLIVARLLQGIGGCVQPLAQAVLLESFPPELQGAAMAAYGTGIVVAPVIGPTLGGWVTDSYSWRWIFYINIPVGLLALFMVNLFVEDPPYLRHAVRMSIDYLGFGMMAIWLGSMQLVLDKGQEMDWFGTGWICWATAISVLSLVGFIVRELTCKEPIVQLRIFLHRNFRVGMIVTGLYGFTFFGVITILPLFLQTMLGYSALDAGMAVSPRGVGALLSMVLVGVLVNYVDSRILLALGFAIFGYSTLLFSHINLGISMNSVILPNVINGFAGGFIFVPLTTMVMGSLRKQEIGNAAGIYNLMRNVGGSIGIATVTTMLERGSQAHQNYLAANLTAGTPVLMETLRGLQAKFVLEGANAYTAQQEAFGRIYRGIQQQSSLLAYADNFRLLSYLTLLCIPLLVLFNRVRKH